VIGGVTVGLSLASVERHVAGYLRLWGGITAAFLILSALVLYGFAGARSARYIFPIVPPLALAAGYCLVHRTPALASGLRRYVAPVVALTVAVVFSVVPSWLTRDLNAVFKARASALPQWLAEDDRLAYAGDRYWEVANPLLYYADRRLETPAPDLDEAIAHARRSRSKMLLIDRDQFDNGGLRIYTTLNPVLQRAAEGALARGLDRLEGQYRALRRSDPGARLQGAIVALDARTGEIRAMVGGRDYGQSQFNRVVQARRQPGSAFKPFVYLAALGQGPRGEPPNFTPASLLEDRPLTVGTGRNAWTPRNYENRYEGTVTVRRALEQSLNAATVWMSETVGYDAIVRTAREAGFTSPMDPVPALVLGSFEVTPIELASAFAALASGGDRVRPTGLRAVVDREGGVSEPRTERKPGLRPDETFLITYMLEGVIERGTGASARALGVGGPIAGKTGTTNDGRDAWFVGYTPRLVALVWVGFDQRDVMRLSGAQAALPIWADFMRTALGVVPASAPEPPPSITFREIDAGNGKLATSWCPVVIREAFLASTEPRDACSDHGPAAAVRSFFRRLFEPGR
jgi:membrane carboxypeptidase/penicillin-binding protein